MESHPGHVPVGDLSHGAHAALFYSSRAEQADVLETFVDSALHANDRLLYVSDGDHAERALKAHCSGGARALASGQFIVDNWTNTYMADGHFDGKRMLAHYRAAVADALTEGYSGLRVAADMGWSHGLKSKDALFSYERVFDGAFENLPAVVLCQYDTRLFDDEAIAALANAHAHAAHPDPLYDSLDLRITRTYQPNGVRAYGQIDLLSRTAFRDALLRAAASDEGRMVVDLSAIKYLDAGSVGAIVKAAQVAKCSAVEVRVPAHIYKLFEMLQPTLPRALRVEQAG